MDLAARVLARFLEAKAPKTYAQAQAEVFDLLEKKGWKVVRGLKVPHATAPNKSFRLWFRPQAIYFSAGNAITNFGDARSAWAPDYRHMSAEQIVAHLERQFADELR